MIKLYLQNYIIKHNFDNPLQTIYKNIIQPLIGIFVEVDPDFSQNEHFDNNIQSEGLIYHRDVHGGDFAA